jgi:hypothetical protein
MLAMDHPIIRVIYLGRLQQFIFPRSLVPSVLKLANICLMEASLREPAPM